MADEPTGFSVTVIDNFHRYDPDDPGGPLTIHGFDSPSHATTYGLRRVRASIEQFREPEQGAEELYRRWIALGEEVVVAGRRLGASHFERFAAEIASDEERDYLSLTPVGARYS